MTKKIKITATGDSMLLRKFPVDYDHVEIKNIIEKGNIKLTNLEMVLTEGNVFASTFCGGEWISSDLVNFDELMKYGFNMYACSNNHSMDYSYGGLIETYNYLSKKRVAFAGIGKSLIEATKPTYYTYINELNQKVSVAMISLTTTFIDAARAGDANDFFQARPGINTVRNNSIYYVNQDEMAILKQIAKKTEINGERDNARKNGTLPPEEPGTFNFGGIFFKLSEQQGKLTECNKFDLQRIIDSIKEAKKCADYVIVMAHSHQIKHSDYTEPDYFFEELCRKCIDEGACCVIGSGTHQLKPIEIYQGKPIFYSLGNFIFESHHVEKLPIDFWDKYNFDRLLKIDEMENILSKNGTVGLEFDEINYLSYIPYMEYENDKLSKLYLYPIELTFNGDLIHKGLPVRASQANINRIYTQLVNISQDYGTKLCLKDKFIEIII